MKELGAMTDEQLIEEVATKVMSWQRKTLEEAHPPYYKGNTDLASRWYDSSGDEVANAVECGDYYCSDPHCEWNPLTDANACKMVREKLAERWDGVAMTMMTDRKTKQRIYAITVYNLDSSGRPRQLPETRADTEERAVVLCALKSLEAQ